MTDFLRFFIMHRDTPSPVFERATVTDMLPPDSEPRLDGLLGARLICSRCGHEDEIAGCGIDASDNVFQWCMECMTAEFQDHQ